MKLLISSILLAGYASADWQPFFWGTGCPAVTGSSNFDLDSYLGTWYNIANSPFFWMSNKNRCVTAEYEMNEDGSIKVTNGDISRYTDKRVSMEGQAVSTPENGVLSVAFGPIKAKWTLIMITSVFYGAVPIIVWVAGASDTNLFIGF